VQPFDPFDLHRHLTLRLDRSQDTEEGGAATVFKFGPEIVRQVLQRLARAREILRIPARRKRPLPRSPLSLLCTREHRAKEYWRLIPEGLNGLLRLDPQGEEVQPVFFTRRGPGGFSDELTSPSFVNAAATACPRMAPAFSNPIASISSSTSSSVTSG